MAELKRLCLLVGLLFTVIVVFLQINFITPGRYTGNKPWGSAPKCKNTEEDIDRLVQLTYKVHSILESMGIDSWLMYGSIWGSLRGIQGPLPWDDDVDLAINGDGEFSKMTFEDFKALFTALGLSVESRLWQSSLIVVSERDFPWPTLDLFVMVVANQLQTVSHISFEFGGTTATQSEVWILQYLCSKEWNRNYETSVPIQLVESSETSGLPIARLVI